MLHQPLLFLPFLAFLISSSFIISYGNNNISAYCHTSKCGDVEVKYPFWLKNNTIGNQYCGYQGFGLDCSPDQRLILGLPGDDFQVKYIDYASDKVILVDRDVTTNLTCARPRHNFTLKDLPLKYSIQDLNLTFYFNCNRSLPAIPVDCLSSGENMSYVSLEMNEFNWLGVCEESVVTTVIQREINDMDHWANILGAMNEGFMLDWHSAIDCAKCEASEGNCGYNNVSEEFLCYCKDGIIKYDQCNGKRSKLRLKIGIGVFGAAIVLFICITGYCFKKYTKEHTLFSCIRNSNECQNLEAFITQFGSLAPRRYTYKDIKKMTNSFKDKIGKGGYGEVYRGNLFDNRPVAVKILNTFKGSGEEFINEVASISRTSHVNIVTLVGFCLDGRRRALVYEFMHNGSLEKYIYGEVSNGNGSQLGWVEVYEISIGIARGLEYLHKGCNTRILHFDIKPHNILLDEYFRPKISDFGLAKLCSGEESFVSITGARGTIGYIAPELVCRNFGGVSHKSDVYSYGMMLLEMVGRRKNVNNGVSRTSEIYFPYWAYQRLVLDEDLKLQGVLTQEENEIARKMILVALWCIQTDPSLRPAMSKVIEMLEGQLQALEIPPKPFFGSPSRSEINSSTTVVELP